MRNAGLVVVAVVLIAIPIWCSAEDGRPRVLVLTDIENEPDDAKHSPVSGFGPTGDSERRFCSRKAAKMSIDREASMMRLVIPCALIVMATVPAGAGETIDAVWDPMEIEFTFIGLDVAYSCDVAEAKVAGLLRHLGAKNVEVRASPCPGYDQPQSRIPMVAAFEVLQFARDSEGDVVQANWKESVLGRNRPRSISDRDCELLEQFVKRLLEVFEYDVMDGMTGCGAARDSVIGTMDLKILSLAAETR